MWGLIFVDQLPLAKEIKRRYKNQNLINSPPHQSSDDMHSNNVTCKLSITKYDMNYALYIILHDVCRKIIYNILNWLSVICRSKTNCFFSNSKFYYAYFQLYIHDWNIAAAALSINCLVKGSWFHIEKSSSHLTANKFHILKNIDVPCN